MAFLPVDEARLTRDSLRYGFAAGKARALERRSLDAAAFERLLDAPTAADQMRLLSDTPYGVYLDHFTTPAEVEQGLNDALEAWYGFLKAAALPQGVVSYFRTRYDYANLKAALKARALGVSVEGLLMDHGSIPREAFELDLTRLPEPLGELARELMADTAAEDRADNASGETAADETPDVAAIDRAVDAAMFARLGALARKAGSTFLEDVTELAVDLANVKIIVRGRFAGHSVDWARKQLIEGGAVPIGDFDRLAALDGEDLAKALQRYPSLRAIPTSLLSSAATLDVAVDMVSEAAHQRAKRGPVGPEPVIAFVFGRESEVAALRALLLGTLSNVNRDALRLRVRPGL